MKNIPVFLLLSIILSDVKMQSTYLHLGLSWVKIGSRIIMNNKTIKSSQRHNFLRLQK